MRAEILRIITRDVEVESFDAEALAAETEGLTGSDLRLVLREAVLDALTSDRTTLTQEDLLRAVENFEKRKNLKELDMVGRLVADQRRGRDATTTMTATTARRGRLCRWASHPPRHRRSRRACRTSGCGCETCQRFL
ncbi:MAG: hypothetical protein U5J64_05440 [Halobacteriales archaeon]|nr:hypothetical protein [Halobacteriales archaeon]